MSYAFFHFIYCILYPIVRLLYPFRVQHGERLPESGPMMVCASHSNMVDPLLLVFTLGWRRPLRFMAKKELLDKPILGTILKKAGSFGVDRGNTDMGAIRASVNVMKEKGNLGIYPEGTRRQEPGEGKNGAIMLAARSGAQIVPVYIPRNKRIFRRVEIIVGEPYTLDPGLRGKEAYEQGSKELMKRIESLKDGSGA